MLLSLFELPVSIEKENEYPDDNSYHSQPSLNEIE
jgi:hypothetical protein